MVICYYKNYENVKNIADAKFIDMKKFCGEIEDGDSVMLEIEHPAIRKLYEDRAVKVEIVNKVVNIGEDGYQQKQVEIETVEKIAKPKRGGRK